MTTSCGLLVFSRDWSSHSVVAVRVITNVVAAPGSSCATGIVMSFQPAAIADRVAKAGENAGALLKLRSDSSHDVARGPIALATITPLLDFAAA